MNFVKRILSEPRTLVIDIYMMDNNLVNETRRNIQMTKGVKIVTIGGGSSYTPELMEGFIKRYDELPIREIWLVDIEAGREKLEIVGTMAQRMWDASPYDVKIHMTLDRREALKDADFVTTQFRVGLLNARVKDERIPFSLWHAGARNQRCRRYVQSFPYHSYHFANR